MNTAITERIKLHLGKLLQKSPWAIVLGHRLWRFTRPRFTAGAVGVIFNASGNVLLVDHVFHTPISWGLPGGYIEHNENPSEGLARELREELALEVEVTQVIYVDRTYGNHLDFAYLCHALNEIGVISTELTGYDWYPLDKLPPLRDFQVQAIEQASQFRNSKL